MITLAAIAFGGCGLPASLESPIPPLTPSADSPAITELAAFQPSPNVTEFATRISADIIVHPDEVNEFELIQECIDLTRGDIENLGLEGFILLDGLSELFLLDLQSSTKIPLDENWDTSYSPVVSNNRTRVAYVNENYDSTGAVISQQLVIADANAQVIVEFDENFNWALLMDWFDETMLVFMAPEGPPGTILLFDSVEGTFREIRPRFLDVYNDQSPSQWEYAANVVYDSGLTRAAYLRDTFSKEGLGLVYWDLEADDQLWQVSHTSAVGVMPRWSPDGNALAFVVSRTSDGQSYELFTSDRTGEITQLTQLAERFPVSLIGELAWAPQGDKIAFWLDTRESLQEDSIEHLVVLDLGTGVATDYCVEGQVLGFAEMPIWSPTGEHIIAENRFDPNASQLIVLDIVNSETYVIAENIGVAGWMLDE